MRAGESTEFHTEIFVRKGAMAMGYPGSRKAGEKTWESRSPGGTVAGIWTGEPGESAFFLDLALIYCAALQRSPNLSGLYRSHITHHSGTNAPVVNLLPLKDSPFQE